MELGKGLTTASALTILEGLMVKEKLAAAVALGSKGGRETAKKGSNYFRDLQAKRKNRKGGRPANPK